MKKKVKVEQKAKEDDVCGDCDAATAAEVVSNIDEALDSEHDADGNLHLGGCVRLAMTLGMDRKRQHKQLLRPLPQTSINIQSGYAICQERWS